MTDAEPGTSGAPGVADVPQAPWGSPQPMVPPQRGSEQVAPRRPPAVAPWVPAAQPQGPVLVGGRSRRGSGLGWTALVVLLVGAAVFAVLVVARPPDLMAVMAVDRTTVSDADESSDADRDPGSALELPSLPGQDGSGAGGSRVTDPATQPGPARDDLGLAVPISSPSCDGSWLVFLGAATDAGSYVDDVNALLARDARAQYTLTWGGCSSMRQTLPDGSLIYAVYVGPYADQSSACAARSALGDGAYVKRMDDVTPPEQLWEC